MSTFFITQVEHMKLVSTLNTNQSGLILQHVVVISLTSKFGRAEAKVTCFLMSRSLKANLGKYPSLRTFIASLNLKSTLIQNLLLEKLWCYSEN